MWDYLVRILRPEDVPKRPLRPEFPHSAVEPEKTRTSTEAGSGARIPSREAPMSTPPRPIRYCPVCHVRMSHVEWRGVEALSCPECEGMFLSRKSLEALEGDAFSRGKPPTEPVIYTPEGVLDRHRRHPAR